MSSSFFVEINSGSGEWFPFLLFVLSDGPSEDYSAFPASRPSTSNFLSCAFQADSFVLVRLSFRGHTFNGSGGSTRGFPLPSLMIPPSPKVVSRTKSQWAVRLSGAGFFTPTTGLSVRHRFNATLWCPFVQLLSLQFGLIRIATASPCSPPNFFPVCRCVFPFLSFVGASPLILKYHFRSFSIGLLLGLLWVPPEAQALIFFSFSLPEDCFSLILRLCPHPIFLPPRHPSLPPSPPASPPHFRPSATPPTTTPKTSPSDVATLTF